jgi:hypothetical protein
MPEPRKDDEKPFAFWLVERFLPHDEETGDAEPLTNNQFYVGLVLSLAMVVGAGVLLRGCAV